MKLLRLRLFQSTLPAGEATSQPSTRRTYSSYFNPRFPRGKRRLAGGLIANHQQFQSTLPAGEATTFLLWPRVRRNISIHASRGGSDKMICAIRDGVPHFNPRFPRGKRRRLGGAVGQIAQFQSTLPAGEATYSSCPFTAVNTFQSTLPAGEATSAASPIWAQMSYFNPRFPRGKRLRRPLFDGLDVYISIHASRGGSDRALR